MTLTMGIEKNVFRPASIDFAKLESLPYVSLTRPRVMGMWPDVIGPGGI